MLPVFPTMQAVVSAVGCSPRDAFKEAMSPDHHPYLFSDLMASLSPSLAAAIMETMATHCSKKHGEVSFREGVRPDGGEW